MDGQETGSAAGQSMDETLDVSRVLSLIAEEREHVRRRVRSDPFLLFSVWGCVWLVGFGTSYLGYGPDRVIPGWLGAAVPAVLIVTALIWSIGYSLRIGRGVSGPSRTVAAMYGWSWSLGFGCLSVVNTALIRRGLSSDTAAMLWSSSALLLTGVLYLAGGMIGQDKARYSLGAWSMLCAAGAVFAGVPGNFLVQSLAGGGGFLAMAGYHWFQRAGARWPRS
ncbi:hypothetical protein [Kitasatospora kifunensis]|uniref:Uncharacterized protein n=1 Tax=Kitasatospora kifunensis TaxID=58351 RepID=A0A7W7VSM3_KITKI|nr:hypothetical protein [Kitasatospora kifunensis]MBB4921331.1 hypothetical protein [Kitasatospora kifunensis]